MTAQVEDGIVTKGRFAEISGVSAGRVSQWIAEGKISGPALVGEGRSARISVAHAQQQLRRSLDASQRFGGNGIGTRLGGGSPAPTMPPPVRDADIAAPSDPQIASPQPPPSFPAFDAIEDKIKREKLFQEQSKSRRMLEEERERIGRYVLAADAEMAMGKIAAQMIAKFSGVLPDMASALAAEFGITQRDVLHRLRTVFDEFRSRTADMIDASAAEMPTTVDDEAEAP